MIAKRIKALFAACATAAVVFGMSVSSVMAMGYLQTNLVSNTSAIPAVTTDPNLQNAWGIAFIPGDPFWISDNNTGLSTLYDGLGDIIPLVVTIPWPTGSTIGSPTGIVANTNSSLFIIPNSTDSALFIFDSEDGTVSAWSPDVNLTQAQIVVDNSQGGSATGAVYKGLAMGVNATGVFLYAANFRSGKIDVFSSTFAATTLTGSFTDPKLPAGFAPFGIANITGELFVTYAMQDSAKHDPVAGPHLGFVDVFDTNGNFIGRFASGGPLNAPWGVAQAPFGFGAASGSILIGNFGDGRISAYNPINRGFIGQLTAPTGKALTIDGLWALTFGGALDSDPGTLYFTAGPNSEVNGLFGSIAAQRNN